MKVNTTGEIDLAAIAKIIAHRVLNELLEEKSSKDDQDSN